MNSISSLPPPASEARRQLARDNARKLLARRRQRLSKIRKRAVAGSVGAFMTAWAAIGFQLVSGHDPALSKSSPVALVSKKSKSASANSTSTDSTSTGSGSTGSGSTGSTTTASSPVAPVTTRQS